MERFSRWLTPVVALFFVTALSVSASSTIGTDIVTGGALTVSGTTTLVGLIASTTAAGSDITLKAMDDVILTMTDNLNLDAKTIDMVADNGSCSNGVCFSSFADPTADAFDMYLRGSTPIIHLRADTEDDAGYAALFVESFGGGASDVILKSTDAGGAGPDASSITVSGGGSSGQIILDAGGSTDEVTVNPGLSTFTGRIKLPTASAPPVACSAGVAAQVYYDTDINEPCYCNASAWTAFDGTGSCS